MALILASASLIRQHLLTAALVPFEALPARIDEASLRDALFDDGATPHDIADALAEAKARKVSGRNPGRLVLGCDQVLDHDGKILSKPETPEEALDHLHRLSGSKHRLHSAIVAYEDAAPIWRHVATVWLTMRTLTDDYINAYVERNWDSIRHSVGGYKIEEEGIRLFDSIEGDHYAILGLPMLPLLSWLTVRGTLPA
ncbi:Maf-like protein YceF [Rhodobacteraceae bacterium THAF1]|uniref:Maf family protein n=1 Tax=Palleronia sp. THAF1 TaxID=2587842 RepID=UPI000F3AC5E6|nr:Maf family protein [Palleronia sp. THAF1]QFU10155.1 Maf-like protein YceF [Palleronia sp. THAF1]VDC16940.1 Maf-like protein YceF [Rhodobacteraceae bacterium THAF1]